MNSGNDIMIEVLRRYRLDRPVPPEVRRRFSRNINPLFYRIIKNTGIYSFIFGVFSFLFFTIRKIVSLVSLKVLAVVTLVTALAAGGIIAYIMLSRAPAGSDAAAALLRETPKDNGGKDRPAIVFNLGVYPVKSSSVGEEMLIKVNASLRREMEKLKGSGFATFAPRGIQTGYTMTGYVERMDDTMILFVKVVSNTTSAIALVTREKIQGDDEIDRICERISRSVAGAVK